MESHREGQSSGHKAGGDGAPLSQKSIILLFRACPCLCSPIILRNPKIVIYFDPRPGPKMLFQGDTPEGSDTFQWPVIERDRVGGLRLMMWDKVKVPLCHYSDAPEESNL